MLLKLFFEGLKDFNGTFLNIKLILLLIIKNIISQRLKCPNLFSRIKIPFLKGFQQQQALNLDLMKKAWEVIGNVYIQLNLLNQYSQHERVQLSQSFFWKSNFSKGINYYFELLENKLFLTDCVLCSSSLLNHKGCWKTRYSHKFQYLPMLICQGDCKA